MTTTNKAPEALLSRLRKGNRFLLTSHINPDGDAIGSALGLARIIRRLGKGAVVWTRDPAPTAYGAVPGVSRIHHGTEPPAGWPDKFDAIVVLECPSLERCGLEEHLADARPILNIDHHLGNQHYGAVNWVDSAAPAVGEMIFRLARGLNVEIDAETANLLYMTIVTDTGGFRFSNTTRAAFESCAELVDEGTEPEEVSRWLYESRPLPALKLLGETLGTLELHEDGRISSVIITADMFERAGADAGDTEGLVDYPRSVAGVEATALLREREDGRTKVSLRSRGEVDVETAARRHGGGGHKNAAGFEIDGTPAEVRAKVVEALAEMLRKADASPATDTPAEDAESSADGDDGEE